MQREKELLLIHQQGQYEVTNHHVVNVSDFTGCLVCLMEDYEKPKSLLYYNGEPGARFERILEEFVNEYVAKHMISDIRTCHVKFISSGYYVSAIESFFMQKKVEYKGKAISTGEGHEVFFYSETSKLRIAKTLHEDVSDDDLIKVLIVDDSATIRKILVNSLESDDRFEVIGEAATSEAAEAILATTTPDVITLDINMPGRSGVDFLKEYFPKYKIPTIMITSLDISEGTDVLEALENGAIDYIQKPTLKSLAQLGPILREKVIIASKSSPQSVQIKSHVKKRKKQKYVANNSEFAFEDGAIVAVGASTGGTEAIKNLLIGLPDNIPPILIAQHIPAYFSKAFADRLDSICDFKVKEAEDGEIVLPGVVYIAPGGNHMSVLEDGKKVRIEVTDKDVGSNHSPCVDYLFNSVADLSKNSVGVLLTGMGSDGAKGLLNMKKKGCYTIAQDQESSVVWGMPKVAYEIGATSAILDILDISNEICEQIKALNKAS